jgi:ATP-dependent DNA ligase
MRDARNPNFSARGKSASRESACAISGRPYEWHVRRATLRSLLKKSKPGIQLSEHLEGADGEAVFHHACAMGFEGIVSKRRDRPYRSGRSPDWIKVKNPNAPAATRIIE